MGVGLYSTQDNNRLWLTVYTVHFRLVVTQCLQGASALAQWTTVLKITHLSQKLNSIASRH